MTGGAPMTDAASAPPIAAKAPERPGPEVRDPVVIKEFKRAIVWLVVAVGALFVWQLAQPLLLVFAAIVFATTLDGGVRLLGYVLPIGRGWRLLLTTLIVIAFFAWVVWLATTQLYDQAATLKDVVLNAISKLSAYARNMGIRINPAQMTGMAGELLNSAGRLTFVVGGIFGGAASLALIVVLGMFIAVEPRLYERGLAWMLPLSARDQFYETMSAMGHTLRRLMAGRLLGMMIEGVGTWGLLSLAHVPMAALLGALTGILAFLPNIGAIVSGIIMILVGFSGGMTTGFSAIAVYVVVHVVDGNIIVPMVAKRSVDLAPALVLGMQLLLGSLLGVVGLALADPIVAMIKVALERSAARGSGADDAPVSAPAALPTPSG